MNKTIIILLLGFCLIICQTNTSRAQLKEKKVFLLAGQSNMDGRANGDKINPEDLERLAKISDRIHFYYNRKPVAPLKLTTPKEYHQKKFNITHSFGPEIFFGIQLAERFPDEEFIFIKRAKGGTSLYGCWNPEWTEEKAALVNEVHQPKLFYDFIDFTNNTLTNYQPDQYQICAMLWVQGETDSAVKKWGEKPANTYGANLKNLIKTTRDTLNVPNLPFIIFQVGNGKVVDGMKKVAYSDDNTFIIPQSNNPHSEDFYEKNPPPVGHYTAKSMKKIGIEFFKVYESIVNEDTNAMEIAEVQDKNSERNHN
ncbi:sialate O-acetylesterase [Marinilabilia rubra]|uniref:Sialate O-acetylesterase domain-containing protein n=1 Tax=Marinilabilia rubra TaxID=2162893 RepID=A0A2U2B5T1_9BACT|nr:sialate O-acetylesterase [Marinilabilia rubra]PWD98439.1 hypothetical protein DDZ16_15275 [Marinilabilia rubra]